MQSQNKRNKQNKSLAYLCALTLLFSYAEMILPRILPFFRLGFANTVILIALEIDFPSFIALAVLKAAAASLMGGTLFSPFFLISLAQSLLSALVMRLLYKLISKKLLSLYGISIAGSAVSALVQIGLASLYLGAGTFSLLGPMLIFNTISGCITAFFCEKLNIKENLNCIRLPETTVEAGEKEAPARSHPALQLILAIILLAISAELFFIKNLYVLAASFILSLIAQSLCKRKIYIIPHITLWLFIFISMIFVPNGEVIFEYWIISITKGALLIALQKALVLSTVSALSQCATCLKPGRNTLLGLSFEYYSLMIKRFSEKDGSIINKIIYSLNINADSQVSPDKQTSQIPQKQTDTEAQ